MAGFANVAAWSNAKDSGNYHISTFRKAVASAATVANDFVDYTYFAGNPVANFYATSPLEAGVIDADRGIYVPSVAPASQFVKCITVMASAAAQNSTTAQNQRHLLADYLMYYPFIDTDAVGEQQNMIQSATLPRYNRLPFGENVFTGNWISDSDGLGFSNITPSSLTVIAEDISGSIGYHTVPTKVGARYTLRLRKNSPFIIIEMFVRAGSSYSSGTLLAITPVLPDGQFYEISFVATATTATVVMSVEGNGEATFDTMLLRENVQGDVGVQIMAVAQSAASTVGQFTVSYTNSDGVSGRTSQNTFTKVVAGGGTLVSSTTNVVGGSQPFIQLQAGDKGVRSIESVTFTAAGGGLMCLVLVKPLQHFYSTQECRRSTSGNLESYGAASQFESVIHQPPVRIQDGALLGIIGLGNAGSLASSVLVGTLETTWS